MRCLDDAAIARLASTGQADPHAETCIACRNRIDRDRDIAASVAALPSASLSASRQRELGAEILSTAQFLRQPRARRLPTFAVASGLAVAAACGLLLVKQTPSEAPTVSVAVHDDSDQTSIKTNIVSADDPAPPDDSAPREAPPHIDVSAGAMLSHEVGDTQDTISLVDGTLTLDTRASRLVEVHVGTTSVRVANSSVIVTARARRVISVQVVVGSARIDSAAQRVTLQRDSLWMPSVSDTAQHSMAIYRQAWLALRSGKNREAMDLFDRVTDPVAREDATYWGAIAAKRAGDSDVARKRIERFLAEFPHSEYVEQLNADDSAP